MRVSPTMVSRGAAAFVLAALVGDGGRAQLAPEASRQTIVVAPELEVQAWAAEPLLANPTGMEVDSRGRVWIAEGLNYRFFRNGEFQRQKGADRIKILADTDGDGKADKVTIFAEDIYPVPMGLALEEVWEGGTYRGARVYVGNSPDLLVLEDRDGDDVAEKRSALLTGFGGIDHDHGVHGMSFGPDGKLYFTQGDGEYAGAEERKLPGKVTFSLRDRSGRMLQGNRLASVFRVNRDGTELELLANGQRNNYECCVDAFGNVFVSDNDDDGNRGSRMLWIMDGGNYGYKMPGSTRHWAEELPGVVPKLVGTGNGSPCGILIVENESLGPGNKGAVLQVDAGTRQINRHRLLRHGAGYRTDHEVFLRGADTWFRPIDAAFAPDGSLFVCDWYDAGVGGHRFVDQSTGRLYRVKHKGQSTSETKPDFTTVSGLVRALNSPNAVVRSVARTGLLAQGGEVRAELLKDGRNDARKRGRALFVLADLPGTGRADVLDALRDPAPELREAALRILTRDARRQGVIGPPAATRVEPRAAAVLDPIAPLATDADSGVRRELILAIRDLPTERVGRMLEDLAFGWDGQDRFYLEALRLALSGREPEYVRGLFAKWVDDAVAAAGEAGLLALPPYFPTTTNDAYLRPAADLGRANAATRLVGLAWVLGRSEAGEALARLIGANPSPELADGILVALGAMDDARGATLALEWLGQSRDAARQRELIQLLGKRLGGSWLPARDSDLTRGMLEKGLATKGLEVETARAIARSGAPGYEGSLERLVTDDEAEALARAEALEALSRSHAARASELAGQWLGQVKGSAAGGPLAAAALAVTVRGDRAKAYGKLKEILADTELPSDLRRRAAGLLAQDAAGAHLLIEAARGGEVPADLATEVGFLVHNHPDLAVRRFAVRRMPAPASDGAKRIANLDQVLSLPADPERGRAVFFREASDACARCHRVRGIGHWVGPDLSSIGVKYGPKEMLYHILNPSGAIGDTYVAVALSLEDGSVLSGLMTDESPAQVVLKTATGERLVVPAASITERRALGQSIMPENLAQALTDQNLADLIAYLGTLTIPVSEVGEFALLGPVPKGALDGGRLSDASHGRADEVALAKDKGRRWRPARTSRDQFLDLSGLLGAAADAEVFARVVARSSVEQDARIIVAGNGPIAVWVNGQSVALEAAGAGSMESGHAGTARLKAGENLLVARIGGGTGTPGMVLTLVADQVLALESPAGQVTPTAAR